MQKATRNIVKADAATKPATKPAVKAAAADKPTSKRAVAPAINGYSAGNITRTAATVAAKRTHYGAGTSRDECYLALYATVAKANGGNATLAQLAASGPTNPYYSGSSKPHDAGALNRNLAAGNISITADGNTLSLTPIGAEKARAILAKLAKAATPA
jgi:hypothetical protein